MVIKFVNKQSFKLVLALQQHDFRVIHAPDVADTIIVKTAIDIAINQQAVTVAANDTDVFVMLLRHFKPSMADMYMLSEKGSKKSCQKDIWNICDIYSALGDRMTEQLPVIHAISGCDTTSALFGLGKASILRKILSNEQSINLTRTLCHPRATIEDVAKDGLHLMRIIYSCEQQQSLDRGRYLSYMNMVAHSPNRPRPEKLPLTERAAYFHVLRVH